MILQKLERLNDDQLTIFKYDWSSKIVTIYQEGLVIHCEELLYLMTIRGKDLVVALPEDIDKFKKALDLLSAVEYQNYTTIKVGNWSLGVYDNADALNELGPNLIHTCNLDSLSSKWAMRMFKWFNPLYKKNKAIFNK